MTLVEQHLLLKTTKSGAQQWRQINLYVNSIGTKWVMKEFKGRSKRGLEFKEQYVYGWREEATLDLRNLIENAENRGFIYKDRVLEDMVDTPFSNFTPIKNTIINIEDARLSGQLSDETHRLIPVHGGVHCCIKIGYDTAFHVEAKTNQNIAVPLPEKVEQDLINMVTLCEYETFVLEAFVTRSDVTIIDILCVNGQIHKKPLFQRMGLLSSLIGKDETFTQLKKPSEVDLYCNFVNNSPKPYWYAIKSIKENAPDTTESTTKLLPQYYVFNVMPSKVRDDILAYRDKKQRIKLLVSKKEAEGHALMEIGEMILPDQYPIHEIKFIESVGLRNGKLITPRICRTQYTQRHLARSCSSQLENLPNHWAANLH